MIVCNDNSNRILILRISKNDDIQTMIVVTIILLTIDSSHNEDNDSIIHIHDVRDTSKEHICKVLGITVNNLQ